MMNEDILNNAEYIYSCNIKWGLKQYDCNVCHYTEEPLPDLDFVICSVLASNDNGAYEKRSLGIMLGFSLLGNQPERYYDKAEEDLFSDLLSIVEGHRLIKVTEEKVQLTRLGRISLENSRMYRFYKGKQAIFEHLSLHHSSTKLSEMFPFYEDMGISTELKSISSYWPEDVEIPSIIGSSPDHLSQMLRLHSAQDNHIYSAEREKFFDIETKLVTIRLYSKNGEYIPVVFNGDKIAPQATCLLNSKGNELHKENAIMECLFKKLWDDRSAILNYETLEPYFELVDYRELTKDSRTLWSDRCLFDHIAKSADSTCWTNISEYCDLEIVYDNLDRYKDRFNWITVTSRAENEFLLKHIKEYPWDLEGLSEDTSRDTRVIEQLIVLKDEYSDEWDWDALGSRLEKEFVFKHLDLVNVDLGRYTDNTPEVRQCILDNIGRKWDWAVIEKEFDLSFILKNICAIKNHIGYEILFDRVFADTKWMPTFIEDRNFISIVKEEISSEGILSTLVFNQKDYLWDDRLIDLFESLGLIHWPSITYTKGFETNPHLQWTREFFCRYNDKVTTEIGKKHLSALLKDQTIITDFKEFGWDWTGLSRNGNISVKFIGQNQTLPWDWSVLTERMFASIKNLSAIGNPRFVNKWNWDYLSEHLPEDFVIENLTKYACHWNWDIVADRLLKEDNRLNISWLTYIAKAIDEIRDSLTRESVWSYLTSKYRYEELKHLLEKTYADDNFAWDHSTFYEKPEFDVFTQVSECRRFIDWQALSSSSHIDKQLEYDPKSGYTEDSWNNDIKRLIAEYQQYWDFKGLSTFSNLNDKDWFLTRFAKELDWKYISGHSLIFTTQNKQELNRIINAYREHISFHALSQRTDIDIRQIMKIAPGKDYDYNALLKNDIIPELTIDEIKKLPNYEWDWTLISWKESFKLSSDFVTKHFNKPWDWNLLSQRDSKSVWSNQQLLNKIIENESISNAVRWDIVTGRKYFPAYTDILHRLPFDKINWKAISDNHGIMYLLSDFKDHLNWKIVSGNKRFDVNNIDILSEYSDKVNWHIICSREDFSFTDAVLSRFANKLDWTLISESEKIKFTVELVDKYHDYWNWRVLANNRAFYNNDKLRSRGYTNISQENISTFIDAFPVSTPRAYHFTHIHNAANIIKSGKLMSRNRADGIFENSAGTNVTITHKAHDFARFYFTSHTPTQFYNEFLGKDRDDKYYESACKLGLPKCPMPIFFIVDIEELLTKFPNKCYYSNGNMQKCSTRAFKVIEDPHRINAEDIYDEYNKDARQQEFLFDDELDLTNLASLQICCYNNEQRDMLISWVDGSPLSDKIIVKSSLYNAENKQLKFEDSVDYLKVSTANYIGQYEFKVEYAERLPEVIDTRYVIREKGNAIFFSNQVSIKKDAPFKIYFESSYPRKGSWLIYNNK